jgi:hypothetical protein
MICDPDMLISGSVFFYAITTSSLVSIAAIFHRFIARAFLRFEMLASRVIRCDVALAR